MGLEEERDFQDFFLFGVDGHFLTYMQNRVVMVTYPSLSWGMISAVSCAV